jgi:hypothetical protein
MYNVLVVPREDAEKMWMIPVWGFSWSREAIQLGGERS